MPLIILRSVLFHLLFYPYCAFWFIIAIGTWPFPPALLMAAARGWARGAIWLHAITTGARFEFRGLDRIPAGSLLVAAKHHSAWETMALLLHVPHATYILKRELLKLPLFGWHLVKAQQIPIDRGQRQQALAKMQAYALEAVQRGRQIVIFPEGTRRKAGAPPEYKFGVARMYAQLNVPCIPVALTSGLAWPRNTLLHYPRRIIMEYLEPIPAGLPPEEFFERLKGAIEDNTNRLLAEAGYTPTSGSERRASPSQPNA
ncbi:MAG: lysophospholipid acyltransferase family protein [Beijerinckiaceae bacterium]|nr:lysophospholipid acyltransferase family protein [Beijerinckiaceae bacterium]